MPSILNFGSLALSAYTVLFATVQAGDATPRVSQKSIGTIAFVEPPTSAPEDLHFWMGYLSIGQGGGPPVGCPQLTDPSNGMHLVTEVNGVLETPGDPYEPGTPPQVPHSDESLYNTVTPDWQEGSYHDCQYGYRFLSSQTLDGSLATCCYWTTNYDGQPDTRQYHLTCGNATGDPIFEKGTIGAANPGKSVGPVLDLAGGDGQGDDWCYKSLQAVVQFKIDTTHVWGD